MADDWLIEEARKAKARSAQGLADAKQTQEKQARRRQLVDEFRDAVEEAFKADVQRYNKEVGSESLHLKVSRPLPDQLQVELDRKSVMAVFSSAASLHVFGPGREPRTDRKYADFVVNADGTLEVRKEEGGGFALVSASDLADHMLRALFK